MSPSLLLSSTRVLESTVSGTSSSSWTFESRDGFRAVAGRCAGGTSEETLRFRGSVAGDAILREVEPPLRSSLFRFRGKDNSLLARCSTGASFSMLPRETLRATCGVTAFRNGEGAGVLSKARGSTDCLKLRDASSKRLSRVFIN